MMVEPVAEGRLETSPFKAKTRQDEVLPDI